MAELAAAGRSNKEIAPALFMGFEHGRGAPVPRLPQARDPLARLAKVAAADGEGNGALILGVSSFRAADP